MCVLPLGSTSLSIRIKGLQKPRSLSRVSTDPLIWNAKCVREWERPLHLSAHICICTLMPVCVLPTPWPKMATLFALLHSCGWMIKMQKSPGACVCVKVCVEALVFLRPERSLAKQIPSCLCYRATEAAFLPASPACWCPFQPAACASQHPFQSVAQGMQMELFWKANSGCSYPQLPRSDANDYSATLKTEEGRIDAYKYTRICTSAWHV